MHNGVSLFAVFFSQDRIKACVTYALIIPVRFTMDSFKSHTALTHNRTGVGVIRIVMDSMRENPTSSNK
jgi:hypothetical protein